MCGIVVYFGDAPNRLSRILTGMWAIIYRAPDSTGVGVFGDDSEPVRTRKAVGSVAELIKTLQSEPLFPNAEEELRALWCEASGEALPEAQRRLLELEGLGLEHWKEIRDGVRPPSSWLELLDEGGDVQLTPGMVGSGSRVSLGLSSAEELRELVHRLGREYDLPPLAAKSAVGLALQQRLEALQAGDEIGEAERDQVQQAWERVFEEAVNGEPIQDEGTSATDISSPGAADRERLWEVLQQTDLFLSPDHALDGVACVFRLLDSLVLSRIRHNEALEAEIQSIFANLASRPEGGELQWRQLYRAEKGVNLFGLAAAAALTFLQRERYLPAFTGRSGKDLPPGHVPGQTHPTSLNFLAQPVLAQGRWALQSPVNVINAHPFVDARRERSIVLNGQFSTGVEARLRDYLRRVAGAPFRSDNSSEFFALLWGHFYDVFSEEQQRYRSIRRQVELGLEELAVGSQAIDHQVFHRLQHRDAEGIDELAFIETMKRMIEDGGQVAVVGMSLASPGNLFIASHNRPLFIVKRPDSEELMVVSDVNAALGLFPQWLIQEKSRQMEELLRQEPGNGHGTQAKQAFRDMEARILEHFQVQVIPLEGERLFARIRTELDGSEVLRRLEISDFEGQAVADVEPFTTKLNPLPIKKDLNKTFYETHLQEVPDRFQDALDSYLVHYRHGEWPEFNLRKRVLLRRFGNHLTSLRRIILVGMGAATHVAAMAKNAIQELIPEITVVVLSPVDVDDVGRAISPDRDLVIMLSWSGTTADMVQFAQDLKRHNVVMIGITEKPFADMALVIRNSAGVIPVLSGEEVTITGVKSTLCMLFVLQLLCIHLAGELGHTEAAEQLIPEMKGLPQTLKGVLQDKKLGSLSREIAAKHADSAAHIVIDAHHSTGTGREIGFKLEESSWVSVGKTFDYRDLETNVFERSQGRFLAMVNATYRPRLEEAQRAMELLEEQGVAFWAITFEHERLQAMRDLSRERCIVLPKVNDLLQPHIDLVFSYQLGLHFGLAHGRKAGEFPRNRVKSVTASRSRPQRASSPAAAIKRLEQKNRSWAGREPRSLDGLQHRLQEEAFAWIEEAHQPWERRYYEDLVELCRHLAGPDPLQSLLRYVPDDFRSLAELVLDQLPVDGEIVFLPLDKGADATARSLAQQWSLYLRCPIRVDSPGSAIPRYPEGSLLILLASQEPEPFVLERLLAAMDRNILWFGPEIPDAFERVFNASMGCYTLKPGHLTCTQDLLYAGLSLLFIRLWRTRNVERAGILETHFQLTGMLAAEMLQDGALRRSLERAIADNAGYKTGFFIGPGSGSGLAWVHRFDRNGRRVMEWYPFGESAHGPLVTVDNRAESKYVRLERRQQMASVYGEETVRGWEERFLEGQDVDSFLQAPERGAEGILSPFYAEGFWYVPVLRPDYDESEDNLIVVDASSERYLGQAVDELSTFGCRFARLTVISQRSFLEQGRLDSLADHPVSHLLLMPSPAGVGARESISEFLLPFALNILGVATAAMS